MFTAAQGEVYIRKIDALPEGCTPVEPENGHLIIGHSETGHHHVLDRDHAKVMAGPANRNPEGMEILYDIVDHPTEVKHLRSTDTHKSVPLQPGIYEIRPAREFSPEGWRRVQD